MFRNRPWPTTLYANIKINLKYTHRNETNIVDRLCYYQTSTMCGGRGINYRDLTINISTKESISEHNKGWEWTRWAGSVDSRIRWPDHPVRNKSHKYSFLWPWKFCSRILSKETLRDPIKDLCTCMFILCYL